MSPYDEATLADIRRQLAEATADLEMARKYIAKLEQKYATVVKDLAEHRLAFDMLRAAVATVK